MSAIVSVTFAKSEEASARRQFGEEKEELVFISMV